MLQYNLANVSGMLSHSRAPGRPYFPPVSSSTASSSPPWRGPALLKHSPKKNLIGMQPWLGPARCFRVSAGLDDRLIWGRKKNTEITAEAAPMESSAVNASLEIINGEKMPSSDRSTKKKGRVEAASRERSVVDFLSEESNEKTLSFDGSSKEKGRIAGSMETSVVGAWCEKNDEKALSFDKSKGYTSMLERDVLKNKKKVTDTAILIESENDTKITREDPWGTPSKGLEAEGKPTETMEWSTNAGFEEPKITEGTAGKHVNTLDEPDIVEKGKEGHNTLEQSQSFRIKKQPVENIKVLTGFEFRKSKGFWEILKDDVAFIKKGLNRMKEDILPSLRENLEDIVTLKAVEDPSALEFPEPEPSPSYYPGLSGMELLRADADKVKGYVDNAVFWFMGWRIPLQSSYDPHMVASYFNRRPHVLLFRIIQVSAAFASAFAQLEVEKFVKPLDKRFSRIRGAELTKEALIKLGPTFIKAGQSLSTRPDLVGEDTAKVMSELQDNLPPFPTYTAFSIIEEELGYPTNMLFSYLSNTPVASASFGQVYRGITTDGQEVAIKVQRPDLLHLVALDVYILRLGLDALRVIAKRRSDLKLYADELGQGLFGELNYTQEAANAAEFQAVHSKVAFVQVPKILKNLSTSRVLTMEWIHADRPGEMLQIASLPNYNNDAELTKRQFEAKRRLFSLVNKGIEASLIQLLETGILHADPHPGNMLYTKEGKLVFLDFGLLCRMEKRHQLAMVASVAHIVNADWKSFVQDLADMEVLPANVDRRSIAMELEEALADTVPQKGIPDIKFSKVLVKVLSIALRNHFKMPPYFVFVLRSIASLEGLALAVDPDFKVFAASYPFVLQRLLTDNSPPLRKVLISLILNDKKQFRWDRVASFVTLAKQHSQKRVALETCMDPPTASTVPEFNIDNADPELIPLLVNLLSSEKGSAFRQLILEADTFDLASTFSSRKAAALRRSIATKLSDVLYQCGKDYLKERFKFEIQSPDQAVSREQASVSEKAFTNDMKSLMNCSDKVDISLFRSKQMQSLLQTLAARLRMKPLSMIHTGWIGFTVICYAMAIAAHKLLAASFLSYFDRTRKTVPQLITV